MDPDIQNELTPRPGSERWKRGIFLFEKESFLSDVIKLLATSLYQFKSLHLLGEKTFRKFQSFEDSIGSC